MVSRTDKYVVMPENINAEEQPPTNSNLDKETPSNEEAPSKETTPLNQPIESDNMEVHHHPHTHGRKNWRANIWEFFMLFLAVFCGFMAENLREHYVEGLRAKVYAKSLIEDLAKDTVEIHDVIREDKIVLTCFDSISSVIQKGVKNNEVPGSFYYYSTIGTVAATVVWNNATFTQITQSGNLRYFGNAEVVTKISKYYSVSEYITSLNSNDKRYREKSMELRNRVLKNYLFMRYSPFNTSSWGNIADSLMNNIISLESNDPELLNEFANSFEMRRSPLGLTINTAYPLALSIARDLIILLKREYRLE